VIEKPDQRNIELARQQRELTRRHTGFAFFQVFDVAQPIA
jgi:hypothetical protein